MTWFDPTREPRIEWSRYVRRSELARALGPGGMVRDMWPGMFDDRRMEELGDPLIVVVGSTRGIEPWYNRQAQLSAVAPDRTSVFALFDAITGARLGAMPVRSDWGTGWEFLDGLRPAVAEFARAARITLTPTPDRHPSDEPTTTPRQPGRPLTQRNIPAALEPTFSAYPLAPGSSWTWRVTSTNAEVRWSVEVVTETIEAVWLGDQGEEALVQSRLDVERITPERNGIITSPGVRQRVVGAAPADADEGWLELSDSPDSPFRPGGVHPDMSVLWMGGPDDNGHTSVVGGPETIETPAGVFDGCWSTLSIGGASWDALRWFCPGVGYVRYALGDAAMDHQSAIVADLIRWHGAELPQD